MSFVDCRSQWKISFERVHGCYGITAALQVVYVEKIEVTLFSVCCLKRKIQWINPRQTKSYALNRKSLSPQHTKNSQSLQSNYASEPCTEINLFHAITMYLVITLCDAILYFFLTVLKGVNGAVGSRNKATVFHGWKYSNVPSKLWVSQQHWWNSSSWWMWPTRHPALQIRVYVSSQQGTRRNNEKKPCYSKVMWPLLWKFGGSISIQRNKSGDVDTIHSSWGACRVDYNEGGNLKGRAFLHFWVHNTNYAAFIGSEKLKSRTIQGGQGGPHGRSLAWFL